VRVITTEVPAFVELFDKWDSIPPKSKF